MRDHQALVSIRGLSVGDLQEDGSVARIIHEIDIDLHAGRCLALVGESGCGKSTLAKSINRTLKAPAVIEQGEVLLQGKSLLAASLQEMNRHRWADVSMIVQSALDALNPVKRISAQILDVMKAHGYQDRQTNEQRMRELFRMVELPDVHLHSFPHELSGGMRQRAIIAMALALSPKLLIMDEPTTALDVVTQMDILARIKQLQSELNLAILFITHDLPLALDYADEIAVMYAGEIVELGPASELQRHARHPYTAGLMHSFPVPSRHRRELHGIGGRAINFSQKQDACAFYPRCSQAQDACQTGPVVDQQRGSHRLKCRLGFGSSEAGRADAADASQVDHQDSQSKKQTTQYHQVRGAKADWQSVPLI